MSEEHTHQRGFVHELRRRHVVRTAVGYAAVIFVLLQLGEIILPAFFTASESDALIRLLVVGAVLFSPIVLLMAWVYEITPMGIRSMDALDEEAGRAVSGQSLTHRLAFLVATILAMGGAGTWWWTTGDMPDVAGIRGAGVFQGVRSLSADGPIGSLAVLPLEDLAAEPGQEYFAPGMHDALINELTGTTSLRVASRASVVQYDPSGKQPVQIGSELGVDALVTGSVLRADGQVRISAQLIHAASETQLWSETYVRDLRDIIALQREVAEAVTGEIQRRLDERRSRTSGERLAAAEPEDRDPPALGESGAVGGGDSGTRTAASGDPATGSGTRDEEEVTTQPTVPSTSAASASGLPALASEQEGEGGRMTSPETGVVVRTSSAPPLPALSAEAQEKLMQGRMFLLDHREADPERARVYFQEILEEDSTFVPALTGVAGSIMVQGMEAGDAARLEEARVRAREALVLNPESVDALDILQVVEDALIVVRGEVDGAEVEAMAVDMPNTSLGRWAQSQLAEFEARGYPSDEGTRLRAFSRRMAAGDLEGADELGEQLLEGGQEQLYLWEAMEQIQRLQSDAEDLLELRRTRAAVRGREAGPSLRNLYFRMEEQGEPGYWTWKLEELTARQEAGLPVLWTPLAMARLATGDEPGALDALRRAIRDREPMVALLRQDPVWDDLRGDPRFQRILETMRERRMPSPPAGGGSRDRPGG